MNEMIVAALREIERTHDVRVLLAVESGSRAWGFASPDSDYDVRFVYAHPRDWYLSVQEQRDVIEQMLPGDLDVSGWDMRKALRLFAKCNLAFNEWLGSPVQYLRVPGFAEELNALLPRYFNPIAGMHHYRRMASAALEENLRDDTIGIKKLFYVLRPLLACRWIANLQSQPPTEFARLVDREWVSQADKAWIADMLDAKSRAVEAQAVHVDRERIAGWREEIAGHDAGAATLSPPDRPDTTGLDAVLRKWVV